MAEQFDQFVKITRTRDDQQIVYGMVYEPNVLDTWGEMMLPSDVELMAHRFMQSVKLSESIDRQHDNVATTCYPIESFIARKGDPDYPEGSWVLGVKIVDPAIWDQVKRGELNGFSYQCMVRKIPAVVEVEIDPIVTGAVEEVEDHTHLFYAEINEAGVVVRGRTSTVNGHYHDILGGTVTEEVSGHSHRFFV